MTAWDGLSEQRQQQNLRDHGLQPRRRSFAAVSRHELRDQPVQHDREQGQMQLSRQHLVFDAMQATRGVYLFDEFDALALAAASVRMSAKSAAC